MGCILLVDPKIARFPAAGTATSPPKTTTAVPKQTSVLEGLGLEFRLWSLRYLGRRVSTESSSTL